MELICINNTYSEDQLKVFAKHKIRFPQLNEIVTLLRVEKLPRIGKTGFIVQPYENQYIVGEMHGMEVEKEVSFDKSRFTTLLGNEVSEEEIKDFKEEQKGTLELIPIKKQENLN